MAKRKPNWKQMHRKMCAAEGRRWQVFAGAWSGKSEFESSPRQEVAANAQSDTTTSKQYTS